MQIALFERKKQRMSIINRAARKLPLAGVMGALLLMVTYVVGSPVALAHGGDSAKAYAHLRHTPYGSATLKWSPESKELVVTVKLTGQAPNSTHPAHIHAGDCDDNGPVVYMLNNAVADSAWNANVSTTIANVENGIPSSGWYVNVHNGPGLTPADQFIPIACGNVSNSHTSLHQEQTVHINLGATTGQNQAVKGFARLKLHDGTLTVVVSVEGLVPGSVHAEHIHAGSCQDQVPGSVVYMLNNLVGNADGDATATTVIHGVHSIPEHGWYINVHRTTVLTNQTDFDPISCGNVED
jgi:hypothetical protein